MRSLWVFLALVSGISISLSAEKKNEAKQAVTSNAREADKSGVAMPSLVVNVTGSTPSVEHPCKASNCDKEPQQSWWHKLWFDPIATFTGALFIATAALIFTGLLQWRETRKVAKHQLRAYLGATPQNVNFLAIGTHYIQTYIEIANTGDTPAKNVIQWTDIAVRAPTDNKTFPLPAKGYGKRPIVPGAKWSLGLEKSLTDEELQKLMSEENVLFVWGRVEYMDIFGESHWLDFRYRNIGKILVQTPEGEQKLGGWSLYAEEDGNDAS